MSIYNDLLQQEIINNFPQLNTDLEIHNLFSIISKYNISMTTYTDDYTDLQEKINLFISGKKIERLSESTLKSYKLELSIFAKHIHKKAEDITTNDIRMYLSKWDKLKISSLSKKISILKTFFSWLRNEDIIAKDNAFNIKTPKKEKRLPKALTIEELELVRESCVTLREKSMVEIMYASGCRLQEIYNIDRFNDINWANMTIHIIGKGNKERIVHFGFKAKFYLNKYLESRTDDDSALFITIRKPYRKLSMKGIQREIRIIALRSGITKSLHPHVFRHSLCTNMTSSGANLSVVKEIMGHSSVSTTMGYIDVTEDQINQTYKKCFNQ